MGLSLPDACRRGRRAGLLDALPPLLSPVQDMWECPLMPILAEEMVCVEVGQEVVWTAFSTS